MRHSEPSVLSSVQAAAFVDWSSSLYRTVCFSVSQPFLPGLVAFVIALAPHLPVFLCGGGAHSRPVSFPHGVSRSFAACALFQLFSSSAGHISSVLSAGFLLICVRTSSPALAYFPHPTPLFFFPSPFCLCPRSRFSIWTCSRRHTAPRSIPLRASFRLSRLSRLSVLLAAVVPSGPYLRLLSTFSPTLASYFFS